MSKKLPSVAESIRITREECARILATIDELKRERSRVMRAPRSIEERLSAFNRTIDQAAARYWNKATDEVITTALANNNLVNFGDSILPFQAAFFGEQIKNVMAAKLRESVTGAELTTEQKTKRAAECDEQIRSLWTEFEDVACQIEAAGMTIDRRGDLPPDIYLVWNNETRTYSENKLRNLERRSDAFSTLAEEYQRERRDLQREVADRKNDVYYVQRNGELPWQGNISSGKTSELPSARSLEEQALEKLSQADQKLKALSDRYAKEQSGREDASKLLSECRRFLEGKAIDYRATDRLLRKPGDSAPVEPILTRMGTEVGTA